MQVFFLYHIAKILWNICLYIPGSVALNNPVVAFMEPMKVNITIDNFTPAEFGKCNLHLQKSLINILKP